VKRVVAVLVLLLAAISSPRPVSTAGPSPTIDQFPDARLSDGSRLREEGRSHRMDGVQHGRRNVYTASAPQFHALRVTNVRKTTASSSAT